MKLTSNERTIILFLGFMFLIATLYLILADFYQGVVQVTVAVVQGGNYRLVLLHPEIVPYLIILVLGTSICLAIGFGAEMLPPKQP